MQRRESSSTIKMIQLTRRKCVWGGEQALCMRGDNLLVYKEES